RLPGGERQTAAIVGTGRAPHREGNKVVLAPERGRGSLQRLGVERTEEGPLEPAAEWRRRGRIEADVVAIAATEGALACVEAGTHGVHRLDPAIGRKEGIQRP